MTNSVLHFSLFLLPYILAVFPGTWIVRWILKVVPMEKNQRERVKDHLPLSEWIGVFERWIAINFIMFGHIESVAFIVAAKGLLRMPELRKSASDQDSGYVFSSYILLGTLVSVMLAMALAEAWMKADVEIFGNGVTVP
jgi:hypothetical protein